MEVKLGMFWFSSSYFSDIFIFSNCNLFQEVDQSLHKLHFESVFLADPSVVENISILLYRA